MSFIKNRKIRTKILAPVMALSLLAAVGMGYTALQFKSADRAYLSFISKDNVAAVFNARATANVYYIGYTVKMIAIADAGSAARNEAIALYDRQVAQINDRLKQSAQLSPQRADAVTDILGRIADLDHIVQGLKQETDKAKALALSEQVDARIKDISPLMTAGNEQLMKGMADGSATLSQTTDATILYSVIGLALSILAMLR